MKIVYVISRMCIGYLIFTGQYQSRMQLLKKFITSFLFTQSIKCNLNCYLTRSLWSNLVIPESDKNRCSTPDLFIANVLNHVYAMWKKGDIGKIQKICERQTWLKETKGLYVKSNALQLIPLCICIALCTRLWDTNMLQCTLSSLVKTSASKLHFPHQNRILFMIFTFCIYSKYDTYRFLCHLISTCAHL